MKQSIDTAPRIQRPDDFYAMLIDAHAGLADDDSMKFNAKLVLLLANHVGDMNVLAQAVDLAGKGLARIHEEEVSA